MQPDLALNLTNSMNGVLATATSGANKDTKTQSYINQASQLLTLVFSSLSESSANSEAESAKKAKNDIDTAKKKTEEKTAQALDAFKEKIEACAKKIEANLKQVEDANKEKQAIEAELESQTAKIEQAAAVLNGEAQSDNNQEGAPKDRKEALKQLQAAGVAIEALVSRSEALTKIIQTGTSEIEQYQGEATGISTEMETTVNAAFTELNQETTQVTREQNRNNNNQQTGDASVKAGEAKIAEAQAGNAIPGGNVAAQKLMEEGQKQVNAGTTLTESSQQNLPELNNIKSAITTDLTKFQAEYASVGAIANNAISAASQAQSAWGTIGSYEEYYSSLKSEYEALNQAITTASSKPIFEVEEKDQKDAADEIATQMQNNGEKVFDYDTQNLRGLFIK